MRYANYDWWEVKEPCLTPLTSDILLVGNCQVLPPSHHLWTFLYSGRLSLSWYGYQIEDENIFAFCGVRFSCMKTYTKHTPHSQVVWQLATHQPNTATHQQRLTPAECTPTTQRDQVIWNWPSTPTLTQHIWPWRTHDSRRTHTYYCYLLTTLSTLRHYSTISHVHIRPASGAWGVSAWVMCIRIG